MQFQPETRVSIQSLTNQMRQKATQLNQAQSQNPIDCLLKLCRIPRRLVSSHWHRVNRLNLSSSTYTCTWTWGRGYPGDNKEKYAFEETTRWACS